MNRKACGILLAIISAVANGLLTAFRIHHPYSDFTLAAGMLGIVLFAEDKRLLFLAASAGAAMLLFAFLGIYNWLYGVTMVLILLAGVAVLVYDKLIWSKQT